MRYVKFLSLGVVLSTAAGCAEENGKVETESRPHYALVASDEGSTVFVLGDRPPVERLPAIMAEERTEYWYTRIEVPHRDADDRAIEPGGELRFQLADPSVPVRYTHTMKIECNPYDVTAEPIFCWVVLRLEAGEPGLDGEIVVRRPEDGGLRIDMAIAYEGTYSKFDGQIEQPYPATLSYTTDTHEALASDYVQEVEL